MTKIKDNIIIEIDGERYEVPCAAVDQDQNIINEMTSLDDHGLFLHSDGLSTSRIKIIAYDPYSRIYKVDLNGQLKQIRVLRALDLMIEKMGLNISHAKKLSIMEAPMPGLVTAIKISIGDHVVKGTPLVILEAMKMENVIAAPHDAVIKEISVMVGQAVERGLALLEFE